MREKWQAMETTPFSRELGIRNKNTRLIVFSPGRSAFSLSLRSTRGSKMSRLFPHGGNKIDTRLEKKIWAFILHDRDGRGINTGGDYGRGRESEFTRNIYDEKSRKRFWERRALFL